MSNTPEVSFSSSFAFKSRCKFCAGLPKIYFYGKETPISKEIKKINYSKQKINEFWYDKMQPINFTKTNLFSFNAFYKNYNPSAHKNRLNNNFKCFNEILLCECNKTAWIFTKKGNVEKIEVFHRKAEKSLKIK